MVSAAFEVGGVGWCHQGYGDMLCSGAECSQWRSRGFLKRLLLLSSLLHAHFGDSFHRAANIAAAPDILESVRADADTPATA